MIFYECWWNHVITLNTGSAAFSSFTGGPQRFRAQNTNSKHIFITVLPKFHMPVTQQTHTYIFFSPYVCSYSVWQISGPENTFAAHINNQIKISGWMLITLKWVCGWLVIVVVTPSTSHTHTRVCGDQNNKIVGKRVTLAQHIYMLVSTCLCLFAVCDLKSEVCKESTQSCVCRWAEKFLCSFLSL